MADAATRRVAVVGGGIAGLECASALAQHGYQVSLFDMGKSATGGLERSDLACLREGGGKGGWRQQ